MPFELLQSPPIVVVDTMAVASIDTMKYDVAVVVVVVVMLLQRQVFFPTGLSPIRS